MLKRRIAMAGVLLIMGYLHSFALCPYFDGLIITFQTESGDVAPETRFMATICGVESWYWKYQAQIEHYVSYGPYSTDATENAPSWEVNPENLADSIFSAVLGFSDIQDSIYIVDSSHTIDRLRAALYLDNQKIGYWDTAGDPYSFWQWRTKFMELRLIEQDANVPHNGGNCYGTADFLIRGSEWIEPSYENHKFPIVEMEGTALNDIFDNNLGYNVINNRYDSINAFDCFIYGVHNSLYLCRSEDNSHWLYEKNGVLPYTLITSENDMFLNPQCYKIQAGHKEIINSYAMETAPFDDGSDAINSIKIDEQNYYQNLYYNYGIEYVPRYNSSHLPPPPGRPSLLIPANLATNVSTTPTITWGTEAGATTYRIEVSSDSTFPSSLNVVDSTLIVASDSITTPLSGNAVYYWRVWAANDGGPSGFSDPFNFTTNSGPPAAPGLLIPANNAMNVTITPTLLWGTVPYAASYRIQVSTVSTFATAIVDDSTLTAGAEPILSSLSINSNYYWRVNAKNADGTSAFSTIFSFITSISTPVPGTPANNATNVSVLPTLTWSTAINAATYRIQVSTVSTFTTTIVDDSTLTVTSKLITSALDKSSVYYWRVNANNAGYSSAFSTAFSFTTELATPTLTLPVNNASTVVTTPTLTWETVAGATAYRVEVSLNSTFTTIVAYNQTVTAGSYTLSQPLSGNSNYYWHVSASNAGGTSAYSAAFNFTTKSAPPSIPIPFAPSGINVSTTPTLTWGTSAGAVTYKVQLSTISTFATTIVDDSTITAASEPITTALSLSATYYWRVNAKNADDSTSAFSTVMSFTTLPPVPASPVLVLPASGAMNISLTPTLTWTTATGVVAYLVQVSTNSMFNTTYVIDDTMPAGGSYTIITALANNTTYYWHVSAMNAGGSSPFSSAFGFTTNLATPTLISPANNARNVALNPTLTWSTITDATSYRVQISTASTFASTIINDSTPTGGFYTVVSLLANNTKYYWQVLAKNQNNSSAFSTALDFTTISAGPVLLTPSNDSTTLTRRPMLTWGTIDGAASYHVQLSTISTFATTVIDDSTCTNDSESVTTLPNNSTTYYWHVNAKIAGDTTAYSTAFGFTTASLPAGMSYIDGGTFQMGGMTVGANTYENGCTYPVHTVTVSPFYMDTTSITQSDYASIMGVNPSYFTGDGQRPIESVTQCDAIVYCIARSMMDDTNDNIDPVYSYSSVEGTPGNGCGLYGLTADYGANGYRLPTEAEWEYACRAGSTSDFYWGDTFNGDTCWNADNSNGSTQPVATKLPNDWGLYDMNGNVWQWSNDWFTGYSSDNQYDPAFLGPLSGMVPLSRGGSWNNDNSYGGYYFTSTYRSNYNYEDGQYNFIGFRCVRRDSLP